MLCVEASTTTAAAAEPGTLEARGASPQTAAAESLEQLLHAASLAWVYRARALSRQPYKVSLVSRGRQAVPGWPSVSSTSCSAGLVTAAALGGLAQGVSRALFLEDRTTYGVTTDLPCCSSPSLTAGQLQWLLCHSNEYRAALRGGQLYVERLVQQRSAPRHRTPPLLPGMACVVAGGTKGLGLQYGQQLLRRGCRTLVLTSRGGLLSKAELVDLAQRGGLLCAVVAALLVFTGMFRDCLQFKSRDHLAQLVSPEPAPALYLLQGLRCLLGTAMLPTPTMATSWQAGCTTTCQQYTCLGMPPAV